MPYYLSYHSLTNALVGVSPTEPPVLTDVVIETHADTIPDLNNYRWNTATLRLELVGTSLTKLSFLRRFTPTERIMAREAAKTDAIVTDFLQMVDLAEDIRLDDSDTQAALAYLVSKSVLTASRKDEILGAS